jgi:hypothetical protein
MPSEVMRFSGSSASSTLRRQVQQGLLAMPDAAFGLVPEALERQQEMGFAHRRAVVARGRLGQRPLRVAHRAGVVAEVGARAAQPQVVGGRRARVARGIDGRLFGDQQVQQFGEAAQEEQAACLAQQQLALQHGGLRGRQPRGVLARLRQQLQRLRVGAAMRGVLRLAAEVQRGVGMMVGLCIVEGQPRLACRHAALGQSVDRLRQRQVVGGPHGRQQRVAHRLAHARVAEVEGIADQAQQAPPHQLLHRLGGAWQVQAGSVLQHRQLGLAARQRRQRQHAARHGRQPLHLAEDQFAHALGQCRGGGAPVGRTGLRRAHRLDHHQRVAFADGPHALVELVDSARATPAQRLHQPSRVLAPQRLQGQPLQVHRAGGCRVQLAQELLQPRRRRQVLLAGAGHQQQRPAAGATGECAQQAHAGRIGPVQVFDQHQRRARGRQPAQ